MHNVLTIDFFYLTFIKMRNSFGFFCYRFFENHNFYKNHGLFFEFLNKVYVRIFISISIFLIYIIIFTPWALADDLSQESE